MFAAGRIRAPCPNCGSAAIEQDPDVLDTWFSSALWPFSTLGWPDETEDLGYFYPTDVLVTGWDIIYFWVARMIFMGLEFMGETLRARVHPRPGAGRLGAEDEQVAGQRRGSPRGHREYGADALRFMLVTRRPPGNDLRYHPEKVEAGRNFANKMWNASRFALMNLGDFEPGGGALPEPRAGAWPTGGFSAGWTGPSLR